MLYDFSAQLKTALFTREFIFFKGVLGKNLFFSREFCGKVDIFQGSFVKNLIFFKGVFWKNSYFSREFWGKIDIFPGSFRKI